MIYELIEKMLTGERDGTTLWKVPLGEIDYSPITDPAEGVWVASLAENILRCGQLQPLLLRRLKGKEATRCKYQLIAGRCRLEAMRMLGRTHVSAIVVKCEPEQAGVLALSENLMRREGDYIELAEQISSLLSSGWQLEKLAPLLSLREERTQKLLELLTLPPEELRLLRAVGVRQEDAVRLLEIPDPGRRALLEKCYADPEADPSALIEEMIRNPDPRLTQSQKVWVGDVRIFLNTVERGVETMQKAGYDTEVKRDEEAECYSFSIRVAKRRGQILPPAMQDVSRETSKEVRADRRFSSMLNIFEALAEDERMFGADVSRETSAETVYVGGENAEKLEICIDECVNK